MTRSRSSILTAPPITYPEDLPVAARRDEIKAAIERNQVVVIAGETGSGKTTQLPKMCLELGRGRTALIGHTQPRRIAARAVAERLASELGVPVGDAVGFAVRFDDRVGDQTMVKVMTDGVLLAEIRRDRHLRAYDTIILDEAHERSLNIDFLLGYLARILPRRPDLKLVITSATIDTARIATHFGAAIIEVSGRSFPIEVRYRDPSESALVDAEADARPEGTDINEAICDAVAEVCAEGPGDVLVFVPGERDIRDAAQALQQSGPADVEILPLYSRLSAAESHKVFRPHRARRVVVATNVAETSLTVPGIRYVVDTGLARISRFSHRSKVQRLPIEAVSRASADQRAGRCGREAPGICIRLYSEADYLARPEFTDPEILRTNLASVLLTMASMGLGEMEDFPFIQAPERRSISDARTILVELGAMELDRDRWKSTSLGRRMARLPLDPRLARIVVEGHERGCLREVTLIAAALSIQDPRERPRDTPEADALHARFDVDDSDFMGLLRLWDYVSELARELSSNAFRRRCRAEFLNVMRLREWQDIAGQIRQAYRSEGWHANSAEALPDAIHQAMLSGLLSNVGRRDRIRRDYQGTRQTRWRIARASATSRRSPEWVMAGTLVETEGIWAHSAAAVQPKWIEQAGAHLAQRSYGEAFWDPERGEAVTLENVTVLGLRVVDNRRVALARVDPQESRRMVIHHALVKGESPLRIPTLVATRERIDALGFLEDRMRRRDLFAGEDALERFYDTVVPNDATGTRRLERWWRHASSGGEDPLHVPLSVLVDPDAQPLRLSDYPDWWDHAGLRLRLRYRYTPGEQDDGVTVQLPLLVINRVNSKAFEGHIPGRRMDLIAALIRIAPKAVRRFIASTEEVASEIAYELGRDTDPEIAGPSSSQKSGTRAGFLDCVAVALARLSGEPMTPAAWDLDRLPGHLRVGFEVIGTDNTTTARGKDLAALQSSLCEAFLDAARAALPGFERSEITSWDFDDIPEILAQGDLRAYPALVDEDVSVALRIFESSDAQTSNMWQGSRRLLRIGAQYSWEHHHRRMTKQTDAALRGTGVSMRAVVDDCATALIDDVLIANSGPSFTRAGFEQLTTLVEIELSEHLEALVGLAGKIYEASAKQRSAVARMVSTDLGGRLSRSAKDIRGQLDALVYPGFVTVTGTARIEHLPRYLDAVGRRLEQLPRDLQRDQSRQAVIDKLSLRYNRLVDSRVRRSPASLAEVRWLIEELRVSLWAQSMGTAVPVSEERIERTLASIESDFRSMVD